MLPARWAGGGGTGAFGHSCPEEEDREAYLSAECSSPGQAPRLSSSHVHPGRPCRPAVASPEGACTDFGLIEPIGDRRTFGELRRRGRRVRSGPLAITAIVAPDDPSVRMAFAIGRKIGPAVVRNQLRRRLRHIARDLAKGPNAVLLPGAYLISTTPGVADLSFQELTYAVVEALSALGADDRARAARGADT